MGLQGFERRVERTVDGVFSRAFKSRIKPIELGRRLVREMDDHRTLDVRGRAIVPNMFTFSLSPADHAPFAEVRDALVRELAEAAHQHAAEERYAFMGPIAIDIVVDPLQPVGRFACASKMLDGSAIPVSGVVVAPDGKRVTIGTTTAIIGRLPECEIPVSDGNVSRRHAEVRLVDGRHLITDLQSTNGTRVNGVPVEYHILEFGDLITVGSTNLRYEAS